MTECLYDLSYKLCYNINFVKSIIIDSTLVIPMYQVCNYSVVPWNQYLCDNISIIMCPKHSRINS